jgi:hypothetical protein
VLATSVWGTRSTIWWAANAITGGFAYTGSSKDFSGLGKKSGAEKKGWWSGGLNVFIFLHI